MSTVSAAHPGDTPRSTGTTAKGITLVYAQILPVMAIVALFPAIPRLFQQFGAVPSAKLLVPMIVTMPSLFTALFAPFAGWIADRYGRRPCFVTAMGVYVLAGLAPLLLDDLRLVVASRAVLGLSEGFIIAVSSALIADYFGEQRYRWVAWVGISTSVLGTLLIAAGGALADISWRGPFAIYALAIPGFLLALAYIDEPPRIAEAAGRAGATAPFPWRAAALIGSVTVVTSVVYYVEPLNIATMLMDKGAGSSTRVGIIQALTSLLYIAGALLYRRLHARPVGQQLALAGLLIGAGLAIVAMSRDYTVAAVGAAVQQLGAGMIIPTLLAWAQAVLPIEQRGRGMGIWATAFFAGTFLCPIFVEPIGRALGGLQAAILVFAAAAVLLGLLARMTMNRADAVIRG